MERTVYIYSLVNGVNSGSNGARISFTRSFVVPNTVENPRVGTDVGLAGEGWVLFGGGEVTDVRLFDDGSVAVQIGARKASTEELRACLVQDGYTEAERPEW